MIICSCPMAESFHFMTHTQTLWAEGGIRAETAAKALLKLCMNVLEKPANLKYRRVPAAGAAFETRIAACPGAMAVLATCGFVHAKYPDGGYYVLHNVDADLLRRVVKELELGLDTMARLRAKREQVSEAATEALALQREDTDLRWSPEASDRAAPLHGRQEDDAAPRQPAAATIPLEELWGSEAQRQLAARSMIHRIKAREQRTRGRRRDVSTMCAVGVLMVGLFFLAYDSFQYFG